MGHGQHQNAMHQHMRMPSDAAFFFLQVHCAGKDPRQGASNLGTRRESNLDAFVKLWRKNQDLATW